MNDAQMGLPIGDGGLDWGEEDEPAAGPRPLGKRRLVLRLEVTDPDVMRELERRRAGAERDAYVRAALRLGVLSLNLASGQIDAGAVREAGTKLVSDMRELLTSRASELSGQVASTLGQYFDPQSGLVPQRLRALVDSDGELERMLSRHLGPEQSVLARTLASHLGTESALFRMLSPGDAEGLRAQVQRTLEGALAEQRSQVLREFSLDHKDSALSRLVAEISTRQGALESGLRGQVDAVVKEFSLDQPTSALSRLIGRVEVASQQIGRNLTLDDETSALSRLRRELAGAIEEMVRKNGVFHGEVKSTLAALDARKNEADRGVRHGVTFEEQLGGLLCAEAQRLGDVYESTGAQTGAIKNCKTGDFVIELGPESPAPCARIAWEAKEDQKYDLRAALIENEQARKNRQSQLGVFVFSKRTAPAEMQPFSRYGNDLVVIWDAEDPATDLHVKAAYSVARALCIREQGDTDEAKQVALEIEHATRAIEKQIQHLGEVKTWAETISTSGAKIIDRVDKMREALRKEVDKLDKQLVTLRTGESV